MRNLFLLVMLLGMFSNVFAQRKTDPTLSLTTNLLEVNQDGEVRVIEQFQDQWRFLTPEEKQAYNNPGKEIPSGSSKRVYERIDFFHFKSMYQYSQVVIFQFGENIRKGNFDYIDKTFNKNVEFNFAVHVATLVISFILLVVSFILFIRYIYANIVDVYSQY